MKYVRFFIREFLFLTFIVYEIILFVFLNPLFIYLVFTLVFIKRPSQFLPFCTTFKFSSSSYIYDTYVGVNGVLLNHKLVVQNTASLLSSSLHNVGFANRFGVYSMVYLPQRGR